LMMAIPTIATNVGGQPDVIIPNETGWLVPPRHPQALADAIEEVLQNPQHAHNLAQHGRSLVQRITDSRIVAQEVLNAYHTILS
ncbi:MAG: glycosyltransferase, partial [Phototrophicaceae bacterium]